MTEEEVSFETRAWNQALIINNIDKACLATFEDLGDGYGIDAHNVYYQGIKIPGADPFTFDKSK